jgi:hypothetical protein
VEGEVTVEWRAGESLEAGEKEEGWMEADAVVAVP